MCLSLGLWLCLLFLYSVKAEPESLESNYQVKRSALIIGNSDYRQGPLNNTLNDAQDIAKTLKQLGFDVVLLENIATKGDMKQHISHALAKVPRDGVFLFYYAGHGVEVEGINYLIPTHFEMKTQHDLEDDALSMNWALKSMSGAGARINIVILDACRDNPFAKLTRSASRGLAGIRGVPGGIYILYAADEGQVASDNPQARNGLFTQELLKTMTMPGLKLEDVFKLTGREVFRRSQYQQRPTTYGTLYDDFYFQYATLGSTTNPLQIPARPSPELTPSPLPLAKPSVRPSPTLRIQPTSQSVKAAPIPSPRPLAKTSSSPQTSKQSFTNNWGMTFNRISAGRFMMGSPRAEQGRSEHERQYPVTIAEPFYLQITELTQAQWQAVTGINLREQAQQGTYSHELYGEGPDYPMYYVSWEDIQEFLNILNAKGQGIYRLPTEAEWEYAARAGSQTAYSFGANVQQLQDFAWFSTNAGKQSHPVAMKKPNAWGLYDMHGNVAEWVHDVYGDYPEQEQVNPRGSEMGSERIIRGGSWYGDGLKARLAGRVITAPGYRDYELGFRLVYSP
jgi:formylglycine-generating enzyme required for sulfatase activity